MRSNRPNYSSSPAGSSRALDRKPKPKKSRREWNQLLLIVFFMALPVIGLLAIFFQPIRWLFMLLVVAALAVMWLVNAFLFPGRMILSAVYGLLCVFTLVAALSNGGKDNDLSQPAGFTLPTTQPVATSAFSSMYNTMGTSVPYGYYDEADSAEGESTEAETEQDAQQSAQSGYVASGEKSGAEIALENFMEKWRKTIIADMVEYTAPSWQSAQGGEASQQLFWKFAQKPLIDWQQMSAPTGTEASSARTITVVADVNYSGEVRTYQYDAVLLFEDGSWYVDPNSLSSGILVAKPTATPDPNATPTPEPTATPKPTTNPKTKLYYNKKGGSFYHSDSECSSVNKKYLPLSSFTFGDLEKSPYNALKPCPECDPPTE